MKVALVHELLTMRGGAEKVLRVFAEMFPDAPIYTLLYNEQKLGDWFPAARVRPSIVQKRAKLLGFNHHLYLSSFPRAVEAWDFSGFDLVLSSSSAFAHGILTNGKPKHLCYVHAPARYLWDRTREQLERAGKGMLGALRRSYLSRTFHRLRTWDAEAADRPDRLIAASETVRQRIERYWRRDSVVVHPPIDDVWLEHDAQSSGSPSPYYVIVSSLVRYKRIDLAVEACTRRNIPLTIAGEGPDRARLESLAGPSVKFVGYRSDAEVKNLYTHARATLFPGDEDFGLVPLESLACGTPVIAFRGGGALETLTDNTAEFFDQPTAAALADAVERSERRTFSTETCRTRARQFSRHRFEEHIQKEIGSLMGG
jgi:glycosyltransferase involved in cell wall biosynthesis